MKPRENKSARRNSTTSGNPGNPRSNASNASGGSTSSSSTPGTPGSNNSSPLQTPSKSTTSQKSPLLKKSPGSGYKSSNSNLHLKDSEDSSNLNPPIVDEAFLNEILQLDVNVALKLPYIQTNVIPSKAGLNSSSLSAETSSLLNTKKSSNLISGESASNSSSNLPNRSPPAVSFSKNDLWHREIVNRWKAKLGLQNVKTDLREKHLLSFYHSNFIWMKEKSFSVEQMCAALSICKTLLDKILTLPLDEPIATVSTNILNASLENYNKLFTKEQKRDFVQFLQETLFHSYRLYRLAFNVDIKNTSPTQARREAEKQAPVTVEGPSKLIAEPDIAEG